MTTRRPRPRVSAVLRASRRQLGACIGVAVVAALVWCLQFLVAATLAEFVAWTVFGHTATVANAEVPVRVVAVQALLTTPFAAYGMSSLVNAGLVMAADRTPRYRDFFQPVGYVTALGAALITTSAALVPFAVLHGRTSMPAAVCAVVVIVVLPLVWSVASARVDGTGLRDSVTASARLAALRPGLTAGIVVAAAASCVLGAMLCLFGLLAAIPFVAVVTVNGYLAATDRFPLGVARASAISGQP